MNTTFSHLNWSWRLASLFLLLWFTSAKQELVAQEPPAGDDVVLHVDHNAPDDSALNGSCWEDAFCDIQSALAVAEPGCQIWVAAGTYCPDVGTDQSQGSRSATFQLRDGVTLYGGFPSGGARFEKRDPAGERTVLSGDIGIEGFADDNVYHVVTGTGIDLTAGLVGFTIAHGNANLATAPHNSGGGLSCDESGSLTISNCLFLENKSAAEGGAIFNDNDQPLRIFDCEFRGNVSRVGGAVSNDSNVAELKGCRFVDNSAEFGGALYNGYSQSVYTDCLFESNEADYGGAVYNFDYRSLDDPTYVQCIFAGNRAAWGGAMYGWSSSPILRNCCFQGNQALNGGGALLSTNGWGAYCFNSIIWNNEAAGATDTPSASLLLIGDSEFFAYHSLVANSGGSDNWNSAFYRDLGNNIDVDPLFTSEADPSMAPTTSGDLRLLAGSPAIDSGLNNLIGTNVTTDPHGVPRVIGDTVDLGVFETIPALTAVEVPAEFSQGLSVKIAIADLLAAITGGIGGGLSLVSVSPPQISGSNVRIAGDYVVYTPAAGQVAGDRFSYEVRGAFQIVSGTVLLSLRGEELGVGVNLVSVTMADGAVIITAAGIPGRGYQLQISQDLQSWSPLGEPEICPAGGTMSVTDPNPPPGSAYYRHVPSSISADSVAQ